MPDIARQMDGQWSLPYLLDAYGGAHRLLLPKLFFYVDWQWFGGLNVLTTVMSCVSQASYGMLLLLCLRTAPSVDWPAKAIIGSGFFAALFSTTQVNNFLYAMDMQWYLSNLLALAAFSVLVMRQHTGYFFILGTLAALCNFTGLVCLPVGVAWLWLTHPAHARRQILLTVAIVVLVLCYLRNPHNSQHVVWVSLQQATDVLSVIKLLIGTAWQMLRYVALYLASPLSRTWPWMGAVASALCVAVCIRYWLRHLRGQTPLSRWQQLCLLLTTSILLSAVATAYGRMIYPNSATAERYQTLVLPLWPAIIGLVLPDYRQSQAALGAALLAMLTLLAPAQWASATAMADLSNRVHLAHMAARASVTGIRYASATLSYPLLQQNINQVANMDAFLRERRLGYFLVPSIGQVGDRASDATTALPDCGLQYRNTAQRDDSGYEYHFSQTANAPPLLQTQLLQNGVVTGFGQMNRPTAWLLPLLRLPAAQRDMVVFSRHALHAGDAIQLTGWLNDEAVCQQTVIVSH